MGESRRRRLSAAIATIGSDGSNESPRDGQVTDSPAAGAEYFPSGFHCGLPPSEQCAAASPAAPRWLATHGGWVALNSNRVEVSIGVV